MFQSVPFEGLNISSATKPAPTLSPSSVAHSRPLSFPQHPKAFIRTANQRGHAGSHSRSPPPGRRDHQYGAPIGGPRAFSRSPGEYFRFPRPRCCYGATAPVGCDPSYAVSRAVFVLPGTVSAAPASRFLEENPRRDNPRPTACVVVKLMQAVDWRRRMWLLFSFNPR